MKRVVLIGLDPATVDFSDPALPPGMTAEKIHAGVKLALSDFAAQSNGFGFSSFRSTSPLQIVPISPLSDFHDSFAGPRP